MKFLAADYRVDVVGYTGQGQGPQTFSDLIKIFIDLINFTLPILVALALLVFFKGLVAFIAKSGDVKSHEEGKKLMIWGLAALFAMVSIFGILRFLLDDFGFTAFTNFLPLLPE